MAHLQNAASRNSCVSVFSSSRFDEAVIDSLIAFNYKVNDFSLPQVGLSVLLAIKGGVNKLDDRVNNDNQCCNSNQIQIRMKQCNYSTSI